MYKIEGGYYIDGTYRSAGCGDDFEKYFKHQLNLAKGYANMQLGMDDFIKSLENVEPDDYRDKTYEFITECFDDRIFAETDSYYNTIMLVNNYQSLRDGFYHYKFSCDTIENIKEELEYAIQDHLGKYLDETNKDFVNSIVEMYDHCDVRVINCFDDIIDIDFEMIENCSPFNGFTIGINPQNDLLKEIQNISNHELEKDDFDYDEEYDDLSENEISSSLYYLNEMRDCFMAYLELAADTREEILQICENLGLETEKEIENTRDEEER